MIKTYLVYGVQDSQRWSIRSFLTEEKALDYIEYLRSEDYAAYEGYLGVVYDVEEVDHDDSL